MNCDSDSSYEIVFLSSGEEEDEHFDDVEPEIPKKYAANQPVNSLSAIKNSVSEVFTDTSNPSRLFQTENDEDKQACEVTKLKIKIGPQYSLNIEKSIEKPKSPKKQKPYKTTHESTSSPITCKPFSLHQREDLNFTGISNLSSVVSRSTESVLFSPCLPLNKGNQFFNPKTSSKGRMMIDSKPMITKNSFNKSQSLINISEASLVFSEESKVNSVNDLNMSDSYEKIGQSKANASLKTKKIISNQERLISKDPKLQLRPIVKLFRLTSEKIDDIHELHRALSKKKNLKKGILHIF